MTVTEAYRSFCAIAGSVNMKDFEKALVSCAFPEVARTGKKLDYYCALVRLKRYYVHAEYYLHPLSWGIIQDTFVNNTKFIPPGGLWAITLRMVHLEERDT